MVPSGMTMVMSMMLSMPNPYLEARVLMLQKAWLEMTPAVAAVEGLSTRQPTFWASTWAMR